MKRLFVQMPPSPTAPFSQRGRLRIGPCGSITSSKTPSGTCGASTPLM
jgi:hypothetical protein